MNKVLLAVVVASFLFGIYSVVSYTSKYGWLDILAGLFVVVSLFVVGWFSVKVLTAGGAKI